MVFIAAFHLAIVFLAFFIGAAGAGVAAFFMAFMVVAGEDGGALCSPRRGAAHSQGARADWEKISVEVSVLLCAYIMVSGGAQFHA